MRIRADLTGPSTVLLTGGRAPATLELARLFSRAGHRVVVAESLRWPLTRCSRAVSRHYRVARPRQDPLGFAANLLDIVRRECVDLIVPTCEEVFHLARMADGIRAHTRVFAAPFNQLRRLHSKFEFIASVTAAGLAAPKTDRVTSNAGVADRVRLTPGALVLKPEFSRFATETVLQPTCAADVAHLDVSPERPWVVQQFVPGEQVCSYAVAQGGRLTAHTAYRVEYTAGLASTIRFVVHEAPGLEDWARRFVAAESFTGQIAFDVVVTDDGTIVPIECNPRATSGIHLFADQPELARAFLDPDAPLLRASPRSPQMLAVPMLVFGLKRALAKNRFGRFIQDFRASRDVVFRVDDPLPTVLQPAAIAELAVLARRHRRGLLAASTVDIEYNGEDVCDPA